MRIISKKGNKYIVGKEISSSTVNQKSLEDLKRMTELTFPRHIANEKYKIIVSKGKWSPLFILVVLFFAGVTLLSILLDGFSFFIHAGTIYWSVFALISTNLIYKYKIAVAKARKNFNEINKKACVTENSVEYKNLFNGFPKEFENYIDLQRIYSLLSTSRADTLKEAYNIVEQEKLHSDMIKIQEKQLKVQKDLLFMKSLDNLTEKRK